jgi:hypothetical protein
LAVAPPVQLIAVTAATAALAETAAKDTAERVETPAMFSYLRPRVALNFPVYAMMKVTMRVIVVRVRVRAKAKVVRAEAVVMAATAAMAATAVMVLAATAAAAALAVGAETQLVGKPLAAPAGPQL